MASDASTLPVDASVQVRRRHVLDWVGDALALTVLAVVFVWLSYHDGGWSRLHLARAAAVAILAAPVALHEMLRLPRRAGLLVLFWGVGPLLAFAFALERSGFVRPLLVFGLVPIVGLLTLRIWRRPWGPPAVFILLLVAFGAYWERSFQQWLGWTTSGGSGRWLPLSWHNQSGALMAAFGFLLGGVALTSRRLVIAAVSVLIAGTGLAGVWLSTSRGAVLTTLAGCVVLVLAARRSVSRRRTVSRVAAMAGVATTVAALLLSMNPSGSATDPATGLTQPTDGRHSAITNARARVWHTEAALAMFLNRPLTGHGPGSYGVVAPAFTRPQANLTAYAHNEWAEALGEGGLALGVPVLVLLAVGGLLVARSLASREGETSPFDDEQPSALIGGLRRGLPVGAAAAFASLMLHAAIDFDWQYVVLPSLLVVALTILWAEHGWTHVIGPTTTMPTAIAGVLAACVVLVLGIWGAQTEYAVARAPVSVGEAAIEVGHAPWNSRAATSTALALLRTDEFSTAVTVADRSLRWNPGNHGLRTVRAAAEYRDGEIATADLIAVLEGGPFRFATQNVAADALVWHGDYETARSVLDDAFARYSVYRAWGVGEPALHSWSLLVRIDAATNGCEEAAVTAARGVADVRALSRVPIDPEPRLQEVLDDVCGE